MIILALTLTVWALISACKPTRQRSCYTQPILTAADIKRMEREYERQQRESIREIERQRKEVERIVLAETELAHIEQQRAQYLALYDRLTAEMDTATPARQNAITRQIITLDEKLYRLDARRLKAFTAAHAA